MACLCLLLRYVIFAHADGQWKYVAAMAHKDVVLQVAIGFCMISSCLRVAQVQVSAGAAAKKKQPWLGMVYDKLARYE